MIGRALQIFSVLLTLGAVPVMGATALKPGAVAALVFADVDNNRLSTADGHVTILTVVTRAEEEKAHTIADQVPDRYLGNSKFRYLTLVNFQGKMPGLLQGVTRAVIRGRLDTEAKELKPQYEVKRIKRDPRRDVHVIADFDGKAVAKLGLPREGDDVAVFVFNGKGKLIARWNDVPPDNSLAAAIATAAR